MGLSQALQASSSVAQSPLVGAGLGATSGNIYTLFTAG